jgi:hypothetical protein
MKGIETIDLIADLSQSLQSPSIHLWSAVGEKIVELLNASRPQTHVEQRPTTLAPVGTAVSTSHTNSILGQNEPIWNPPSFHKRGKWYPTRLSSLRQAVSILPQPEQAKVFAEGVSLLNLHSKNYGVEGPKHLVLLWWEWPVEYHTPLRHGISMNFLSTPRPRIKLNSTMSEAEQATVGQICRGTVSLRCPGA